MYGNSEAEWAKAVSHDSGDHPASRHCGPGSVLGLG